MTSQSLFRASLRWAFVLSWGQRGVTTVVTFALAAILGPHDFGVVAIAMIYIALVELAVDQGLSTAIVQRSDLEPEHADAAFWMNFAWSILLAGLSIAVSGWWAKLNGAPEVELVIVVLSSLIVIHGLTVVQQALLKRELQFKKLALRGSVAAVAGGACGIGLAVAGAGVWALVAQQLATAVVSLLLLWTVSTWRPRLRFSGVHARSLLGFSAYVFGGNLGSFVGRRADALLIGIFFGPVAVGLYRLADRLIETLVELTTRPVHLISLPHFSRLQHDRVALADSVRACLRTTLLLTVPTMLLLVATSEYITAALGSEWAAATDVLKILAIVGVAKAVVLFTGPLLTAVSKPHIRTIIVWSIAAASAVTFTIVAGLLQEAPTEEQVVGIASSRALLFLFGLVPVSLWIIARTSGLSPGALLSPSIRPLVAGLIGVGVVWSLEQTGALGSLAPAPALLLALPLALLSVIAVLAALEPRVRAKGLGALYSLGGLPRGR